MFFVNKRTQLLLKKGNMRSKPICCKNIGRHGILHKEIMQWSAWWYKCFLKNLGVKYTFPTPIFMQLNVKAFALACGILWAVATFVLGVLAMNGYAQAFVTLIGSGYLGFNATIQGALIGAVWGFVDAFIGGWAFAWLYNKLV